MNFVWRAMIVVSLWLSTNACEQASVAAPRGVEGLPNEVLILYTDTVDGGFPYTDLAFAHAILLQNLIGHDPELHARIEAVSKYAAGEALAARRTFYLGVSFNDPVPDDLVIDAMAGANLTWVGRNLWQLERPRLGASLSRLGLRYVGTHQASTPLEIDASFNRVEYKRYSFQKALAPMEMAEVQSLDDRVMVPAWALDRSGRRIPYALHSGAFWFVADDPFSFMHETDRYLVFADLIDEMLERPEACEPRAMLRLEDVHANDSASGLTRTLEVLDRLRVPFALAVIPQYLRPSGTVNWADRPQMLGAVRYAERIGGRVFQHGYTHQYENLLNPSGVSAFDYEFWDIAHNAPIPGLSPSAALERALRGKAILEEIGLHPIGWVTPHYTAPAELYASFNAVYTTAFERRFYQRGRVIAGQFFPYPVRDVYGTTILPENIGDVQTSTPIPVLLERARANRSLRCPWAGLYFHPYLLADGYTGPDRLEAADIESLILEMQRLGYRFIDPAAPILPGAGH